MLVLMFFIYADEYSHFDCSVNFSQLLCLHVFWLVFNFCIFQKMDQRIRIKFCVKNKIKCPDEERAERPITSTTAENIDEVEKIVLVNRRITVREVAEDLNIDWFWFVQFGFYQ